MSLVTGRSLLPKKSNEVGDTAVLFLARAIIMNFSELDLPSDIGNGDVANHESDLPSDVANHELDLPSVGSSTIILEMDLPSDKISKSSGRVRSGMVRGSTGHINVVHSGRNLMQERRKREHDGEQVRSLKRGWDNMILREGDKAILDAQTVPSADVPSASWRHLNTYSTAGFCNLTYAQVTGQRSRSWTTAVDDNGKRRRTGALDVRHSTRDHEATTTMAGLLERNQSDEFGKFWSGHKGTSVGIRVARGCDATPWCLNFGELTSHLRSVARYFIRETVVRADGSSEERYITTSYEDYCHRFPTFRNTIYGVVEVNVAWGEISVFSERNGSITTERRIFRRSPTIMEHSNASCTHSMYEKWHDDLKLDQLNKLVSENANLWILLEDYGDSASYMLRHHAFVNKQLNSRVLHHPNPCRAHALNNLIQRNCRANDVIGQHCLVCL